MKKIILGFTAFLVIPILGVNAQTNNNIEIRLNGAGGDISGGIHSVNLDPSSPDLAGGIYEAHFDVTNNTGTDQQWRITRKKMNVPATWSDDLCWPPTCFITSGDVYITPNTGGSPAPIIVNGTSITTNAALAEIKPRITPDQSTAGYALYRYYITEAATGIYVDSIDLSINFALGLSTLKQTPTINVSPNPADDYVNFSMSGSESYSIRIVDVLGNVVYNETIANGTKGIDVSNFKNGVYFILIESAGVKTVNRKLIIRH